ncbi:MAG: retropepsin-like aspartic protease family protein [Rhodospirillales bacterium]
MSAGGRGGNWLWLVAGAVLLGFLVAYLSVEFPEVLQDENNRLRLDVAGWWIALGGGSLVARGRSGGMGLLLGNLAIWLFIGLGLLTLYSFRAEFGWLKDRVMAELLPHRGTIATAARPAPGPAARAPVETGHRVSFRMREGGHFVIEARVNGTPIRFLVDTGASEVVLTPGDARRIGFNPNALSYTQRYRTANGIGEGAPIRLTRITVGPIEVEDVRASVNRAEMAGSLLGMTFLGRLSGYEVRDGVLTLRQ